MNPSSETTRPEDIPSDLREQILQLYQERHLLDQHIERALRELQARCGHAFIIEAEPAIGQANRRICLACAFEESEHATSRFTALSGQPLARLPVIPFTELRCLRPDLPSDVLDRIQPGGLSQAALGSTGGGLAPVGDADPLGETLDAAAQQIEKYPWLFNTEPRETD
jgi:hypothetical protein